MEEERFKDLLYDDGDFLVELFEEDVAFRIVY